MVEFEGPFDLLLDEVRRQNVAIEDIALGPMVARYLDYFRSAISARRTLDIGWLELAATLIHWKSCTLLPDESGSAGETNPIRSELIHQLKAHKQQVTTELADRHAIENKRFSRTAPQTVPEWPESVTVWDLIQQARDLAKWVESRRRVPVHPAPEPLGVDPDEIMIADMIAYLEMMLSTGIEIDGARLLCEQATPQRRCTLFLGMLEMARTGRIQIKQEQSFGPMALLVTKSA